MKATILLVIVLFFASSCSVKINGQKVSRRSQKEYRERLAPRKASLHLLAFVWAGFIAFKHLDNPNN